MEEKMNAENKCSCSEKTSINDGVQSLCPRCCKEGILVKNVTVRHLVLDELKGNVGDEDYYLCMSEDCDVTYYNIESNKKFYKEELNVPIWFKKDANPKYACYCSKVTEEEVIEAVRNGAKDMKEVLKITGAMRNSDCQNKNPLGSCCHHIIQDAMDKAL